MTVCNWAENVKALKVNQKCARRSPADSNLPGALRYDRFPLGSRGVLPKPCRRRQNHKTLSRFRTRPTPRRRRASRLERHTPLVGKACIRGYDNERHQTRKLARRSLARQSDPTASSKSTDLDLPNPYLNNRIFRSSTS